MDLPHRQQRRDIARRLKAALVRSGVGQNQLGRELRKTSSAVAGWMSGRTQPSLEELAYICRRLGVSADEILGIEPVPLHSPVPPRLVERLMQEVQRLGAAAQRLHDS